METFKNIILGLLIGVVICMGVELYRLKNITTEQYTAVERHHKPVEMFDRFFDMVLELEARKKMQEPYNRIDEPEAGN